MVGVSAPTAIVSSAVYQVYPRYDVLGDSNFFCVDVGINPHD